MALRLTCPNCGPRPFTEFWFGGEIEPAAAPAAVSATAPDVLAADFDRVWSRANSCGIEEERWFHHAGCRRWHTARRNTLSQEVHAPV
ncbi:MAG: sarcosine oxidase subunit delta [Thermoanaerobaculia bacterium]